MEHDQLFKALLRTFLTEFLELFFADVVPHLRLETVQWLDKEQLLNLEKGESQSVDLLAKVATVGGEPELILIHIEVERQHRTAFRERMWRYYAWLTLHRD
ncbi:MAG: flagellar assembly protein H, partial [Candidatus Binatia bacterium]